MATKLLWGHATCMRRCVKIDLVRSLASASDKNNKQITDSFKIKPTHKAVGTFGSLTVVNSADKAFQLEDSLCKDRLSPPDSEPLVVILGWAGATHKVNLHNIS